MYLIRASDELDIEVLLDDELELELLDGWAVSIQPYTEISSNSMRFIRSSLNTLIVIVILRTTHSISEIILVPLPEVN